MLARVPTSISVRDEIARKLVQALRSALESSAAGEAAQGAPAFANPLAAEYFIRQHGLERVTASYDLNAEQLAGLLEAAPAEWFEITVHQHMPMFHMEHCVFCALLSPGKNRTDCGRPCDRHDLKLRDRVGAEHPVRFLCEIEGDPLAGDLPFHLRTGLGQYYPVFFDVYRWFHCTHVDDRQMTPVTGNIRDGIKGNRFA